MFKSVEVCMISLPTQMQFLVSRWRLIRTQSTTFGRAPSSSEICKPCDVIPGKSTITTFIASSAAISWVSISGVAPHTHNSNRRAWQSYIVDDVQLGRLQHSLIRWPSWSSWALLLGRKYRMPVPRENQMSLRMQVILTLCFPTQASMSLDHSGLLPALYRILASICKREIRLSPWHLYYPVWTIIVRNDSVLQGEHNGTDTCRSILASNSVVPNPFFLEQSWENYFETGSKLCVRASVDSSSLPVNSSQKLTINISLTIMEMLMIKIKKADIYVKISQNRWHRFISWRMTR
jgi:hypothetical protein